MRSLITTALLLFIIDTNALTPPDFLPMLSYKCESKAVFISGDNKVTKDVQKTTVGYIDGIGTGLQQMVHEYDNHKVYVTADAYIGSFLDPDTNEPEGPEHYGATYSLKDGPIGDLPDELPETLQSSSFQVVNDKLPEKFSITLYPPKLNKNLTVLLRLVCEENK